MYYRDGGDGVAIFLCIEWVYRCELANKTRRKAVYAWLRVHRLIEEFKTDHSESVELDQRRRSVIRMLLRA